MAPASNPHQARYPLGEFVEGLTALLEAASDPKTILKDWLDVYFQERHPDITNEPERAQLLLNALRYYEVNKRELDQKGGIVLGDDHSVYPPELVAALYSLVMSRDDWQDPNIIFPVPEFIKAVKRQKEAWEGM